MKRGPFLTAGFPHPTARLIGKALVGIDLNAGGSVAALATAELSVRVAFAAGQVTQLERDARLKELTALRSRMEAKVFH